MVAVLLYTVLGHQSLEGECINNISLQYGLYTPKIMKEIDMTTPHFCSVQSDKKWCAV